MKRFFYLLTALAVILSSCSFGIKTPESSKHEKIKESLNIDIPALTEKGLEDIVEGSFIVKTASNFDKTLFGKEGFEVRGFVSLRGEDIRYWNIHKEGNAKKNLSRVLFIKGVLSAEYDYKVEEPKYTKGPISQGKQPIEAMGLLNGDYLNDPIANNSDYGLKITEALRAYKDVGYENKQVVVGIIDTGINMEHRDFKDDSNKSIVLYAKSAATDKTGKTYVGDGNAFTEIPIGENWDHGEHGTHCSGTIAARGDNHVGIAGVAWKNTKIISYQGLGIKDGGRTWAIYGAMADLVDTVEILRKPKADRSAEEIDALPSYLKDTDYQITQKTVPVNMSLGGSYGTEFAFAVLTNAVKNDVLPVIAMGNEGRYTAAYPAAFPGVLAVGATTAQDKQKDFSNNGAWISISAPGDGVMSCNVHGDDSYQSMSGTSMATPFITGTIGYLLSFDNARNLTPYQIKTLLERTADKIDGMGEFDERYGYGRVNVFKAAKAVKDGGSEIPAPNDIYSEAEIRVKVTNKGQAVSGNKITLIDSVTKAPLAFVADLNDQSPVVFKGLIKGRQYSVYTNFAGEAKEKTFTVTDTDQNITIAFNKEIVWVSTVPSLHYNGGKDKTDTQIAVFEEKADGSPDFDNPVIKYDQGELDTTYFVAMPGKKYYVLITGYIDSKKVFHGGNYAVKIGDTALNPDGEGITDGARTAAENDSHEPDNDPTQAKAKGDAWNKTFACNLVSPGKDADGNDKPDYDFFYIELP
ncbi:dentilisin complex serine proteinase subunit PrtP [Treponema denticola]|uniref:dentilisin complex serine proteinase subunit PrtP n=1 Tax=Treponema denticola TaxID=158 RepID=UPI002106C754|nr:dentilisin complex serine proteinase subunit PrtP [Treponema denticola]UTY24854.1 dentilisin complex serine proteinase subunit PrtP [Treponema denticola]